MEPYRYLMRGLAEATDRILEIGPSYNPIVSKSQGYNVKIVDHCDKKTLVAKYEKFGVDTSQVEDVDYITTDISDIQDKNSFDIIFASHLIEHTPNLIKFLRDATELLDANGKLVLLVPDRQATFDFFRPVSTPGAVIDAYELNRTKHIGTLFDHYLYFSKSGDQLAWNPLTEEKLPELQHGNDEALEQYSAVKEKNEYVDAHSWVFTPESFELIINEINKLGLIELKIESLMPSQGFEFLCILTRTSLRVPTSSLELIKKIQSNYLETRLLGVEDLTFSDVLKILTGKIRKLWFQK